MAQTQVTSVSQDELSKILAGNVESIITPDPETKTGEEKKEKTNTELEASLGADFKWSDIEKLVPEKEGDETLEETTETDETKEKAKPGRKPADILSFVTELVTSGELLPFEEGELKTLDEAKELIKLNLKHSKDTSIEEVKEELKASYSPQIQAILHYADRGGRDITPLLSAIAEVEKTADIDIEKESGQISVLTEYLKIQGWDEEDIKEEIETAKDLDKLKSKAEKFLPKLNQMKSERIEMIMQEQEEKDREVEETRRTYLTTIQDTLKQEQLGDLKLSRQEKSKLWNAVADISHTSFNGTPTNAFYKRLEDAQVGKTADYQHFLSIVYHTIDPEGFKEHLLEELRTKVSADTAKKLKIQSTKANSGGNFTEEQSTKKPAISRGFRNPFG